MSNDHHHASFVPLKDILDRTQTRLSSSRQALRESHGQLRKTNQLIQQSRDILNRNEGRRREHRNGIVL
jgi:hypothetical protein